MENDILLALKNISIETLVVAFIVFSLTMLLKWPIKKFTSNFNENKRKAINTIIVFIPALLSILLSILYHGLIKKSWLCLSTFETSLSSYLLSLSIYAIFSRLVILIKGIASGKIKVDSKEAAQRITEVKEEISSLSNVLNSNNNKVKEIMKKIQELNDLKKSIEISNTTNSLIPINDINEEITKLEKYKLELEKI